MHVLTLVFYPVSQSNLCAFSIFVYFYHFLKISSSQQHYLLATFALDCPQCVCCCAWVHFEAGFVSFYGLLHLVLLILAIYYTYLRYDCGRWMSFSVKITSFHESFFYVVMTIAWLLACCLLTQTEIPESERMVMDKKKKRKEEKPKKIIIKAHVMITAQCTFDLFDGDHGTGLTKTWSKMA